MNKNILTTIIVALIVGAVGFFGGQKYESYKISKNPRSFFMQTQGGPNGQGNQNRNRFSGGRPVVGEIVGMDDKSITVKMADGSTKIVILSDSTTYNKSAEGSKDDLKVGESVGVFGTDNSDGSVTAQNVQLNPQFRAATNPGQQ